jgi:hypothetical protein
MWAGNVVTNQSISRTLLCWMARRERWPWGFLPGTPTGSSCWSQECSSARLDLARRNNEARSVTQPQHTAHYILHTTQHTIQHTLSITATTLAQHLTRLRPQRSSSKVDHPWVLLITPQVDVVTVERWHHHFTTGWFVDIEGNVRVILATSINRKTIHDRSRCSTEKCKEWGTKPT